MPTTFAAPVIKRQLVRIKNMSNKIVCTKFCYVGNHPDGTLMAKYGNLWYKIIGNDADGVQYADLNNGAYAP